MISFQKEQIFIVTGASSGLGKATAILLNKCGATVVAIARNLERLEKMKAECQYPQNCHIEIKDLAQDIEGLPKYVKELKEKYGKFSGMAYCAGVLGLCPERMITYDFAKNVFDVNYFAPLLMTKGVVDKRNNVGKGASFVYISSIDAKLNSKGQNVYGGSKAALSASIKAISREYLTQGLRFNCLLPSAIMTHMTHMTLGSGFDTVPKEEYPFGWGEPEDVANMAVYLLSDKAKFISGQNYIIDSGGVL